MAILSIFVISYNRQLEIKKKINFFYKNFDRQIKIFIIDGSLKKLFLNEQKLINKNIKYIHFPTEDYHLRLNYIGSLIKTPFTQIQNDDDYFDPKILIKCCNLIKKKKKRDLYHVMVEQAYLVHLRAKCILINYLI